MTAGVRMPWSHPETAQLLDKVASDLRRAVVELEAETHRTQNTLATRRITQKEGEDGENR